MKRTALAIVALALAIGLQSCKKDQPKQAIHIEGLFSLTGSGSSLGITSKAALTLAVEDVNAYLDHKKAPFRLSSTVSDTKQDALLATTAFTKASSNGTKFVIGPQTSGELTAIKPLIDNTQMLLVSQSSTAGSLAVAGDAIFRFCPSDKIEGAAMAATIYNKGLRGLVTVARDDAGNKGLQTATGASFIKLGGKISAITPYATTTSNFATIIASIKTELGILTGTTGAGKVGIYLASFDECTDLFKLAAADPSLNGVSWFGGDGVVLSTALTTDAAVANFAIATNFFAPSFGLPAALESKWRPVAARIKAATGIEPDAFALVVYDAVWVIANTLEATKASTEDYSKLKLLFPQQASLFSGITGGYALDSAGDRASGSFDYFGIVKTGTTYTWVLKGKSE